MSITTFLTGDDRSAAANRWQMHVDADGRLRIPALDLDLVAQQLPAGEAGQLAQLLAMAARTGDRPMPDAPGDAPWQVLADVAGAPRIGLVPHPEPAPEPAGTSHLRAGGVPAPGPVHADRVLPLPPHTYLEATATTDADLQALAPQVSEEVRRQVTDADPTLDADLAAWADPACPRPKLTLLGPVTVSTTQGELPADRPRRAWNTEIVAYLACHPRGVTAEQLGTDLWPGDPDITGKSKLTTSPCWTCWTCWTCWPPTTPKDAAPRPTGSSPRSWPTMTPRSKRTSRRAPRRSCTGAAGWTRPAELPVTGCRRHRKHRGKPPASAVGRNAGSSDVALVLDVQFDDLQRLPADRGNEVGAGP